MHAYEPEIIYWIDIRNGYNVTCYKQLLLDALTQVHKEHQKISSSLNSHVLSYVVWFIPLYTPVSSGLIMLKISWIQKLNQFYALLHPSLTKQRRLCLVIKY